MAAVIFDLDGTLLDTAPDIHRAGNLALASLGAPDVDLATARGFVGRGARAYVRSLIAATGLPPRSEDPLLAAFLDHYAGAVALTRPYPGMHDALAQIRAAGHRLGLCTNKPEAAIVPVLDNFDLAGLFETVVGGDTLAVAKPDPAPLRETMARMGAGAALYVGDSEVDAETAVRAACPFILHLRGYRWAAPETLPHAAAFSDWAALPGLVEALEG